ncbi:MAG: hypothetical protein HUU10_13950 [Bacteroidetes bacterium]|nr:hypothetical protein [Bacteroidota bacterium]
MKWLLSLLFLVPAGLASAQDEPETLFNGNIHSISGFGGPTTRFTRIAGDGALMTGGYGGVLLNNQWGIGGGGFGLATEIKAPASIQSTSIEPLYLRLGYGGFYLEYTQNPNKLLHLNYAMLIGAGGFTYTTKKMDDWDYDGHHNTFFVAEPFVGMELNVTNWFHPSIGASYRFIAGENLKGFESKDLSDFTLALNLKFGWFGNRSWDED